MIQQSVRPRQRDHIFYTGLALVFLSTVFVGFSRTYYLKIFFGTPHLSLLAHIHGVVFTLWTIFFVFQATLVATGRPGLHRRFGIGGVVLAAGIVLLGLTMAFHSVRAGYASGRPNMALL